MMHIAHIYSLHSLALVVSTDTEEDMSIDIFRNQTDGCLGGVTVKTSDLRSSGRGFDSRSSRYEAT